MLSRSKLFAALFAATLFVAPSAAHAQRCNTQSLQGAYGYTVTGTITAPVGPLVPGAFAAVGRITFDGFGRVTTVRSLSNAGYILTNDAGTGTYTINADCTGSFNISVGPPNNITSLKLNLVLDDRDNAQIRALVTNPGTVLILEGRKQGYDF